MAIENKYFEKISEISKREYKNILGETESPFVSFEFLNALEISNSVGIQSGWQPNHLGVYDKDELSAFMPLYIKNNSHGEFIFDHQWSYALNRAGRNYYPKLVTAIPFTPCKTEKFIGGSDLDSSYFIDSIKELMEEKNIETWHLLFPNKDLEPILEKNNFIKRSGYRFEWNNKNYSDFESFLKVFTSRQRKNIRAERKKIKNLDISFNIKNKDNLTAADWDIFYKFYKNTYEERMQAPYLNEDFFELVHANKDSLNPVIFFAVHNNKPIAGSLCFQGKNTLYGRHWGASHNIDNLHFECCYYQGIEYCINNNINFFDPGVQGEHKIRRGFEPIRCDSYHLVLRDDFRSAIQAFCKEEKKSIDNYLMACQEYTPIKKEYRI